jgi:hypothetical protein
MFIEPTGFRWINETWIKVDRGAEFYNSTPIGFDLPFLVSRFTFVAIGLLSVAWSRRHFARVLRGLRVQVHEVKLALARLAETITWREGSRASLGRLGMTTRPRGFLAGMFEVARVELVGLGSHSGLWLLIPLLVLNATFDVIYAVGPFETPLLLTPGVSAVGSLVELTFSLCLFLMFYMVESLRREAGTRLSSISYATPVRTSALILGKALANGVVAAVTILAVFATCAVLLIIQGTVPLDVRPYAIVYGLLLGPVVLIWSAFVAMVYAFTGNRFTTYGISITVIIASAIQLGLGKMSWVWNWSLMESLYWSDIAPFELDRTPLVLNRALMVTIAVLFLAVTVRVFPRRRFDQMRVLFRLRPAPLLKTGLLLMPLAAVPIALGVTLQRGINAGPQGARVEEWAKDYWRRNHATWLDAPLPDLARSDINLEVEPGKRWFHTRGSFELRNGTEQPLARIPLTGGPHWQEPRWTLNGEAYEPEDRQGLYLFTPPQPLAPGQGCTIGFDFEGVFLDGFTRNGEGSMEFILPSGIVLTSATPSFVPVVGYLEGIGVDEDNQYDSREYPDNFHEGMTRALFGPDLPQRTRVRITAPEEYTMNSVGIMTDSVVKDGRRTVTWESDHPVDTFNVIGGRWAVRRGEGTAIFHHPAHAYNIDEMIEALDGARRHYSRWFHPFPWTELKLSEFPALADYAQGFATNITFSESVGFLAESDPRVNTAFMVTAHETAHQWWGGLVVPGDGPGGNLLSEGTSHFSTILLFEAVKGLRERIEFCKRIEESYCNKRVVDSERPLVKIDGSRDGDTTVTYDKAGWVFWMLLNHMGRENALEGIRSFITHYAGNRDHPVLQDIITHLRPFAPDPVAYQEFVEQWFLDIVLPEYELEEVVRAPVDGEAGTWEVRAVVRNSGTGRMPVEISAERGVRFSVEKYSPAEPRFDDSRTTVVLGAGEQREIRIRCDFEPKRVVVDPDARILQNDRKRAIHRF